MQNFGRENFDDSTCIRQIRQTFPLSKFYAIRYILSTDVSFNGFFGDFTVAKIVDEFFLYQDTFHMENISKP